MTVGSSFEMLALRGWLLCVGALAAFTAMSNSTGERNTLMYLQKVVFLLAMLAYLSKTLQLQQQQHLINMLAVPSNWRCYLYSRKQLFKAASADWLSGCLVALSVQDRATSPETIPLCLTSRRSAISIDLCAAFILRCCTVIMGNTASSVRSLRHRTDMFNCCFMIDTLN